MGTTSPARLDAATLRNWLVRPTAVTVIDVRSPAEFSTAHVHGSINVPLNMVSEHAEDIASRLDGPVVLVCQSGARAEQAQQRLAGAGAEHLHVLDGGMPAYVAAGGDVIRGPARWAMERQVRLVAGALVLAGLAAGLRAPRARLLAAGVGTGLTLSALTDTCTMGRALSALPYNRGPRDRAPAEVLAQLPTTRATT